MTDMQLVTTSGTPDLAGAIERYNALVGFVNNILKDGVDYGIIPGSDKKCLLKPGAEKLSTFFNLSPRFIEVEVVEDWTGKDHGGEPFFYYKILCQLSRNGQPTAECLASINSWEQKYRYRQGTQVCPECGKAAIFRSKKPGEGFYCWNKKGGCGAQFKLDDKSITDQVVGQVANPQIFDQVNTMIKMGQKRALVGAVLIGVGASEFFTQDMDEVVVDGAWTEEKAETRRAEVTKREVSEVAGRVRGEGFDDPPLTDEHGNPIETVPVKSNGQKTPTPRPEPPPGEEFQFTTYARGVLTYRKVNGVEEVQFGTKWKPAQAVSGKDLKDATIDDLLAMFVNPKTGKPDQFEATGHIKKHFEGKMTWRALTWEQIMACVMLKKKGLPDPDFYPDEYKVWEAAQTKTVSPTVEIVTVAAGTPFETTAYTLKRTNLKAMYLLPETDTTEAVEFLDQMEKLENPETLIDMVKGGITGATPEGLEKLLTLSNMITTLGLPTTGPEFDEVINYYLPKTADAAD